MDLAKSLLPTEKLLLIDLVKEVGMDVDQWTNIKNGKDLSASNPKYCYEWCFVDKVKKIVLLNLWYHELKIVGDSASYEMNLRKHAKDIRQNEMNVPRERRALAFDSALQYAYRTEIQVRVIFGLGIKKDLDVMGADGSRIEKRRLDSVGWSVAYDMKTGQCTLTRGEIAGVCVDQFDLTEKPVEYKDRSGKVFIRSPHVRKNVLLRSGEKCEWCDEPGFLMKFGQRYLETHHIIPLSEGGEDSISNVVALCPNHHREAHFGRDNFEIKKMLVKIVQAKCD